MQGMWKSSREDTVERSWDDFNVSVVVLYTH